MRAMASIHDESSLKAVSGVVKTSFMSPSLPLGLHGYSDVRPIYFGIGTAHDSSEIVRLAFTE